jgi:hypothetical protein
MKLSGFFGVVAGKLLTGLLSVGRNGGSIRIQPSVNDARYPTRPNGNDGIAV